MDISQATTIFNYNDIIFSFIIDNESVCTHRADSHMLVYVYSGKMVINDNGDSTKITSGECIFIKRDHRVVITKGSDNGENYQGITMKFSRNLLRECFKKLNCSTEISVPFTDSIVKICACEDIDSIFYSIIPYFNTKKKPREDLMELKLYQGLISLLHIDKRFYSTVFDFTEPWKIDILDFLSENFMYDLTVEEIALYTGRSLSSFKRDFAKISNLSPQKWIIKKRLDLAYEKIKLNGEKIGDVCFRVGFKNRSHFTTAFKKQFGCTPDSISKMSE
ncbi:AraC family transcriptional regulator [Apibacter raozihei]|uniref:helix-turn-helix domain-containing protein n=1 Tax=Apibacter raozihei TaxID=2500547 RepID=UPI000FE40164|nr:helix-turn-helix domain-containing protein [Apibacter raozihei]